MKFSSVMSFCRKEMLTSYVTVVGIFLQARQIHMQLDNCSQKTSSCPESKQLWETRSMDFNCSRKETNYTCLLTKKGDLVETCISKIKVEKGVVGCPFIMLCLDGLPQVGVEKYYMDCPEHILGCPPKDHEAYTFYEMYKYPACFYYNKSEAIHIIRQDSATTVLYLRTTYRNIRTQNPTTEGNFPVFTMVIIAIILLILIVVAVIVWFTRNRRQGSSSPEEATTKNLLDRTERQTSSSTEGVTEELLFDRNRRQGSLSPKDAATKNLLDRRQTSSSTEEGVTEELLFDAQAIPSSLSEKFAEDGKREIKRVAPQEVSNIEPYYLYRRKDNETADYELLHADNWTKPGVLTQGIPIEKGVYNGVAAGQRGTVISPEYPSSENMLKEKVEAPAISPSLHVKFIEDGNLEITWEAPHDVYNIHSYYIYRKKNNEATDWELLHTDNGTKTRVLTHGIPTEEAVFYGIAAGQNGKIISTEYPMSEKMLKEKAKKEKLLKFQNDLLERNDKQTKKIPLSSQRRANAIHIDNLYSSVVVREDKGSQRREEIKVREVEQRVEHPRDIFYVGDKRTRYVFMIGLPARGKTAYCQWLTHKWCTARQKRQEEKDLDEWEKGLNEFDFLFFVQLRNISKVDSVSDMICSALFNNDSESCIFIQEIFDSDDSRCLIILDGLDELKSDCTLPDMDKMRNCSFFISTRPWKYDDISHMIDDKDKVLEIKGLDENGIKSITENVLCHYYGLSKTRKEYMSLYDTITRKSRIGAIKKFMHIPLLAIICVQVLYEHRGEGDLGTNITEFYIDMIDLLIKRAREKNQIRNESDVHGCPESAKLLSIITNRNKSLYQYSEVLMKLAKLAFDGLTSETKDKLIMNEDDLLRQIGKGHLQFALDVGFLSQSDENAYFNKVEVSISFFHKTVQEVFAAIYIAVRIKEKFMNDLTHVKKILEFSYVIMFISGLKPDLGRLMLQHIADVLDKDTKVSEYRSELLDTADRSDISSVFKLQIDCFREIQYKMKVTEDKTNTQTATYHVSDVMLEDFDDDFISDTAELLDHHLPTLKSAYFLRVPSRGKNGIDDALLTKFLDNTRTLKSLFISGFEQGRILHHLRVSTLTVLSLMYVSISDVNPVDDTYSLEPLLNKMHSLQTLKLNHVTLGNKDLGINAEFRELRKIVLQWVKMSLWDRFFQSLSLVQHKYEVKLSYSDADDVSMEKLYRSPHFQITWYGGKSRTHFYRIKHESHSTTQSAPLHIDKKDI